MEHRMAETLRKAVLEPRQDIPGLRVAFDYRFAEEPARVGGDFYDVFELNYGLVGLAIGDVSGMGPEVAALAALVRYAIRSHAMERGKTPADVVRMANEVLLRSSVPELFATVFFAILDRRDGRLVYCNAGHPSPALLRAGGGDVVELEATSPLIGVFPEARFVTSSTLLERRDLLLLYTDGLIEARAGSEQFGEQRLRDVLLGLVDREPDAVIGEVVEAATAFADRHSTDDMALLAVQLLDPPIPGQLKMRLA
jgi:phosphoserine phosphatase RsbU/P